MQVAAEDPGWVTREEVPEDVLEAERAIYKEQAKSTGKPENVLDRIVEGKMKNFYEQRCLVDQPFIKEQKESVGQRIDLLSSKLGEKLQVKRFIRFELAKE